MLRNFLSVAKNLLSHNYLYQNQSNGVVAVGQDVGESEKFPKFSMQGHDDVMSSHPIDPFDFLGLVSLSTSIKASSLYLEENYCQDIRITCVDLKLLPVVTMMF